MDKSNPFNASMLNDEQTARLVEAAKMIAGDDEEILETIYEITLENLKKFIGDSKDEEIITEAIDKAEGLMPDIAFGDSGEIIEDFLTNDNTENDDTESLGQLLKEDDNDDSFMGDNGKFTSLEEMQDKEEEDPYSFETLQEDWN